MVTESQKANSRRIIAERRSAPPRVIARTRNSSGQLINKRETSSGPTQQEVEAQKAEELSAVANAKTFEEKTRISREIVESRKARQEQERIEAERKNLTFNQAIVTTKISTDARTGDQLRITETRRNGRIIRDTQNLTTGTTITNTYAPGKAGGSVRQTGGIIIKETKQTPPPVETETPQVNPASTDTGFSSWLSGKYTNLQNKVSDKLYNIFGFSEEEHNLQRERVLETEQILKQNTADSSEFLRSKGVPNWIVNTGDFISNIGIKTGTLISGGTGTIAKQTLDKPITTPAKYAALGAVGYGAGLAVTGITTGAAAIGAGTGAFTTGVIGGAGTAIGGKFLYDKGMEIYNAPTSFEQGGIIANTVLETSAVAGGFISGQQGGEKIGDWFRTRGRTEVPVENIVIKDVISGKTKFVESKSYGYKGSVGKDKQSFDIKIFEKQGSGYHVTPDKYWNGELTTMPGSSEFPGLYVAPSPSVYFGKAGAGSYKLNLFGGTTAPKYPAVANIKTDFTTTIGGAKAFVTGIKPEIEAVIPPGLTFLKTGGDKFFTFKGRRFPIDNFGFVEGTGAGGTGAVGSGSSGAYTLPSYSFINPGSIATYAATDSSSSSTTTKPVDLPLPNVGSSSTSYKLSLPKIASYGSSSGKRSSGGSSSGASSPTSLPSSIISKPSSSKPISAIKLSSAYRPSSKSRMSSMSSFFGPSSYGSISKTSKSTSSSSFKLPKAPTYKQPRGLYGVEVRRGGKFFNVGTSSSLKNALSLGQSKVGKSLAASYRIKGLNTGSLKLATPKGFYSKTDKKEGLIFIEKNKFRLGTGSETSEIQRAKSAKRGKKSSKTGSKKAVSRRKKKKKGLFDF